MLREGIGEGMAVSYKRLWKRLIDKDMKKKDLAEQDVIEMIPDEKWQMG